MNTFFESAKKCFDTAAIKTSEAIDISKKYIDVTKAEKKLSSLYERLGEAIYNTRRQIKNEEILSEKVIDQIDDAQQEVMDAKRRYEASKSVKCRFYGQKNSPKNQFCSKCGEILKND